MALPLRALRASVVKFTARFAAGSSFLLIASLPHCSNNFTGEQRGAWDGPAADDCPGIVASGAAGYNRRGGGNREERRW